ncbi:DUF3144 domain-containing protein [Shewanella baltica]|uniref:DUF3144 domain-containing protein n=1 Tax=Shewanella baltica (strain OS155 / ATCC BAA-1091) TaxID=325240 RepID=A3D591_SHEB5|nr:DUF3144 domain-containing protein [Shewanella baltica]ABN61904.1 conserved hypothetical protein [Shewanella baltica OS155]AEH14253.1 hypothetical protein Sbal117_2545 [Shewanella baltica OS117]MCS6258237.1 DUF3144 domain-containing protein [Shewanella baltica]
MSDNEIPPEFWERADQVIAIANEQTKDSTIGKVSSSLLYAAARFNAFNVASSADSIDEMIKDKEEAIRYFTEQYKKMLTENLDEYIESYNEYKPHG